MSTAPLPAATISAAAPKLSFFRKFENVFENLFHAAPKWEHAAITVVNFAAPFVMRALALFDPAAAVVATPIINIIKSDLATLYVMTGDGTQKDTVATVLARIQANFSALLKVADVKDPATQAQFTATANLIIGEFQAVQGLL